MFVGPTRSKKGRKRIAMLSPFWTYMVDQRFCIFCNFFMIHKESSSQNWAPSHCWSCEEVGRFGLCKWGPQKSKTRYLLAYTFLKICPHLWWISGWYWVPQPFLALWRLLTVQIFIHGPSILRKSRNMILSKWATLQRFAESNGRGTDWHFLSLNRFLLSFAFGLYTCQT